MILFCLFGDIVVASSRLAKRSDAKGRLRMDEMNMNIFNNEE